MKLEFDRAQIAAKLDSIVNKTLATDLVWDWPCGVGFYGITRAAQATGKKEYIERLGTWVRDYASLGLPDWTVNTCSMGHTLLTLYAETGDSFYLELIESKLDYLQNKALRFGDRVLQHTVSVNNDFPEQAWADTLFMAAYFMLRAGVQLDRRELVDDALNQYYWHIEYLQDKSNGLWYHGYNNIARDHMSGFYWGRANAWAAYTMSRVKRTLPEAYLYPQFMDIDCALRDQLGSLKALQTEGGLWRTLLDDGESYEEVSAACGIAAAMLTNNNPLHTKYVQAALDGVLGNISDDGRVLNVSGGTAVMRDREGYRNVPRRWIQGWGQGLAMAFLARVLEEKD